MDYQKQSVMNSYSGTKCPKCEHIGFELVIDEPMHSKWKYQYIRCSNCKSFLAVLPYNDTTTMIENLHNALADKLGIKKPNG